MFDLVPPSGTPISLLDLLRIMKPGARSGKNGETLDEKITRYTGAKYCYLLNSGRSGLTAILYSLRQLSTNGKNEVVIPAYTCFSVAAAIARSGFKIRLVDINLETLDYDYESLSKSDLSGVLAIIGCNLFGILSDWEALSTIAAGNKIYLIDDAAQSMGLRYRDRLSGTLGDIGFYSLGRGKNLSTVSGGIIITDNDAIAKHISNYTKYMPLPDKFKDAKSTFELFAYSMFLKPGLYRIPAALPFLKLGETIFDENFPIAPLANVKKRAARQLLDKLDNFNTRRQNNSIRIAEAIFGTNDFKMPGYSSDNCPAYLRLPLMARDETHRDSTISALRNGGISATIMYPSSIGRIKGIEKYLARTGEDCSQADDVARRLLTLPTHPLLKDRHINKIIKILAMSA